MATAAGQHVALPANDISPAATVSSNEPLAPNAKRNLIIIAVFAAIIIIVVICIAASLDYKTAEPRSSRYNYYDYYDSGDYYDSESYEWDSLGDVDYVCGTAYGCTGDDDSYDCFNLNDWSYCYNFCEAVPSDDYDMYEAYQVDSSEQCYCYTYSQLYDDADTCRDLTNTTAQRTQLVGISYGRPYYANVEQSIHPMTASIKQVSCHDYAYYQEDEDWNAYVTQKRALNDSLIMYDEWLRRGLAEHASIASFAKNSLELMSIGAPLWLLELSTKAGLDEIKHCNIAFDVVNMMRADADECVTPNEFPAHQVELDADWNRIALDIARGGCIAETVSALKLIESVRDDGDSVLNRMVLEVANDEVRHAALAWVSVKWMMDVYDWEKLDVADSKWWVDNAYGDYGVIVSDIAQKLWIEYEGSDPHQLMYNEIVDELSSHVNDQQCVYNM